MIDTDYWTEHHYSGHNFLIKSDEPPSKWDGYCEYLLYYRTIFGHVWTPDTVDAIQPPTGAVRFTPGGGPMVKNSGKRSKAPKGVSKVIPPVEPESPLGGVLDPSQGIPVPRTCPQCAQPIKPTGKRGRPRTIHKECR